MSLKTIKREDKMDNGLKSIYKETLLRIHYLLVMDIFALVMIAVFRPQIYCYIPRVFFLCCIILFSTVRYYIEVWFYIKKKAPIPYNTRLKLALTYIITPIVFLAVALT
jgi:hypothetical protein